MKKVFRMISAPFILINLFFFSIYLDVERFVLNFIDDIYNKQKENADKIFCFYNIYDEFDELIIRAKSLEEAYYIAGYDYVLEDILEDM